MDDKTIGRALTWVGSGGTALAVSTLLAAAAFAVIPDRPTPTAATLDACHPALCAAAGPQAHAAKRSTHRVTHAAKRSTHGVTHAGRATHRSGAPAAPAAPASSSTSTSSTSAPAATTPAAPPVWITSLPNQHLAAPIVAMATSNGSNLYLAGADGGVFPIGEAGFRGSLSGQHLASSIAAVAADPVSGGYWLAGRDGGVFGFGARYHGSLSGTHLASPVMAMAATPTGGGYWLVSADGGVFAFGDAVYHGSLSGTHLASPVVAMASTASGHGYWLVSADGGVFAFGDARYHGSLSGTHLASPVVAMAPSATGHGYWLVSVDGGVFAFGDAPFHGSSSGTLLASPVSAIVPSPSGNGYWIARKSGVVSSFGDAVAVAVAPTAPPAPAAPATAQVVAAPAPSKGNQPAPNQGKPAAHPGSGGRAHSASTPSGRPAAPAPLVDSRVDHYPSGSGGVDISQYQCGTIPGGPAAISVVQVTGGALDNAPNPCFVQEALWAGRYLSTYIYMDGLPSTPPPPSLSGPAGHCAVTNIACASYNYGYNYARHWVDYSRSVGVESKLWWLDVEKFSGWQDTTSNRLVISGALDGLKSMRVDSGVYSTAPQWNEITGGMAIPGQPIWVAGAGDLNGPGYTAANFCAAPGGYSFGGGRLAIVQYGYEGSFPGSYSGAATGYDLDLAC